TRGREDSAAATPQQGVTHGERGVWPRCGEHQEGYAEEIKVQRRHGTTLPQCGTAWRTGNRNRRHATLSIGGLMVSIPECFSESYAEARAKFCGAAATAGGAIKSWLNPNGLGPNGENLYLDTARFGAADANRMLVMISSTHGVEGHCGSGAEIAWLRTGGPGKLPKD